MKMIGAQGKFYKSICLSILFLGLILNGSCTTVGAADWKPVGNSRQVNISGMALAEKTSGQTAFIVVHDNKKKKQDRAGVVRIINDKTQYTPLEWRGDLPVDLEAISVVPDLPGNFMALTSAGRIYHIKLDLKENSVSVIKSFDAPAIPAGAEFEGFALQKVGGDYLVAWAERGEDVKPATLFWSKFDPKTYSFTQTESLQIKVPYPKSNVRHISDIKVDARGRIFISSAADPGNDGPFSSVVYQVGSFDFENPARITLNQAASLSQIYTVDDRKIEAFEIVSGEKEKLVFGTDDENLGSAIFSAGKEF